MEISLEAKKKYYKMPAKKRRSLVKRYMVRGWSADDLAELFSMSKSSIEKDMKKIREQLWRDVQSDEGAQRLLEYIVAELRLRGEEIDRELWQLYFKTRNDAVKLGCLKALEERNYKYVSVMQSLGLLKKAPEKLEVESTMEVNIDDSLKESIKKLIRERHSSSG
jgi:predicted DNA-binding protein YlxM (UPF0122 family)